ncbi:aspartoacylase [Nodosilinea nodulosa]|uniref:aspartoacylase n=1 Tax=Nodosilinea nodulosa TaxID=416001 RepID=UPI0002E22618|nr:aspartoacylase [Nodosilinea nodulosa]
MDSVNRVAIVGGTHGNELIGVQLVKKFGQRPDLVQRSTFSTQVLLGNPQAVAARARYIDRDLNRSFERDRLNDKTLAGCEDRRARHLDQAIGPTGDAPVDVIVDLHSTTSNMGLTLIVDSEDSFTLRLASHLQSLNPSVKVYSTAESGRGRVALRSLAKFGFCLEVGPVAQNVVDARLFQSTEALVSSILDYLDQYNQGKFLQPNFSLTLYRYLKAVAYPKDEHGETQAMIHPELQFKDYEPLHPGDPIFLTLEDKTIAYEGTAVVYPVFINEAAYYEKSIAMYLTEKKQIS